MAGFGTTMSKLIEDDREYYRELATKKRDYLQTYGTKAVLDRDEKANGAVSLYNNLVTAGIPEDSLRYVLDTTGVAGLTELRSTLNSRTDLTKAEIEGLVKKSKDYVAENPDEDISTVIKKAYGLYKSSDKPVERERNLFAAVLGLDARMAEDDVLNDLYVDGFTGTDIYRIMGSSGPKPGEALSLNLPTKPPSPQLLASAAKTLQGQFDASIDAKIKAATRNNNVALVETLEKLKGRGVDAIYEYATAEGYGDPALLELANRIETEKPGLISRNTINLGNFTSEFNSWMGDQEDDTKLESAPNGGETPSGQGTPTGVITFKTASEFDAAVDAGEIKPNTKVKVGSNPPKVFTPPPSYNYNVSDEFPIEEDNRARLLSESTDTPQLEADNRSRLLSEATALDGRLLPPNVTDAILSGQAFGEDVSEVTGNIAQATTAAPFKAVAAISDAVAYAADFVGGALGAQEETSMAKSLRESAELRRETASEIAAEGVIAAFGLNNTPESIEQVAKGFRNTVFTEGGVRTAGGLISYEEFAALKGKPQENVEPRFIRKGMQITLNPDFVEPEPEKPSVESTLAPLDITNRKTTRDTFIPQVLDKIDYGQADVIGLKDMLYELRAKDGDALTYDSSIIDIKTKEDLKNWAEPYFNAPSFGIEFTPEQEKTFIDVTFDLLQQVQDMKKEGTLRRVQDLDRQFLADEKNYPQPITGFVTPAKTEEEKRLEAEMVKVDEALRRVQDLDRQFLADEKNYPQPISAMTSVDPLSINTRSDLKSAISERTGTMPPDYKKQMVSAVAAINETLKTFEDSVNVKTKSAIDAVSISNINESITNIVDRMFDTVVGNETLEDRIMKTEAGQNRAYAFTKLQEQFGALTLFPERIPGDIDLGPTMGEVASDYLHSTQDKINESIASAFKSLLSKIGIGKPESLVTRPR